MYKFVLILFDISTKYIYVVFYCIQNPIVKINYKKYKINCENSFIQDYYKTLMFHKNNAEYRLFKHLLYN